MTHLKNLAVAAVFGFAASVAGAETVLIHGEAGPNRGARANALQWFADQVAERSRRKWLAMASQICPLTTLMPG